MPSYSFLPVSGSTAMFDVIQGNSIIGFVWQRADRWHASETNTHNPSIDEASREAAAEALLAGVR
jgi:hypothetical protein